MSACHAPARGVRGVVQTATQTVTRILRHPANQSRRARALALYLAWQVWERVVRRPWTIRLGDARRMRLYPHSAVAAFVLYYRIYDYEELSFIRHHLRPGDLFVDVGANVGAYSLWASETAGVDVLAFEPSSANYARTVENVELNRLGGQVQVVRKAVGAQVAAVRLTTGLDALNRIAVDGDLHGSEPVEQTTLDTELRGRAPAIVKIDVEGDELDVLRGGRESIVRHRPALIIEVNDPDGLIEVLDDLGYQTFAYDPEHKSLTPAAPVLGANVLALADVDAARARLGPRSIVLTGPPTNRTPLPTGLKMALLRWVPMLRLLLLRRDFLRESGWIASSRRNAPVERDGRPLPWYTYPCVDFLDDRLRPDMDVFEYGAGNSTRWWAERVAHVSSVESDPAWVDLLTPTLPPNADLRFAAAGTPGYARSADDRHRRFDIVVIDGMDRNECALSCLSALKEDGVVIWDNSDWVSLWGEGIAHLEASGFRRIDFRGLGPLLWRPWTTSVFYRPGKNCLGI